MVTSTNQAYHLSATPEGFLPEGISPASLGKETLYLLEHAIPACLGLKIFAHLLSYGTLHPKTSMPSRLFQATGETQHEVIVLITSMDALAKSPGSPCGSETYLKVILLFEALKIIRRTFHRNYTEIRIGLGKREIHIPALLQELRLLHDNYRNKKVKQIAKKVAKRLQSGEFSDYQRAPLTLHIAPDLTPVAPDLTPVAEILTELLGNHGVEHVDVSCLTQACTLVAQAIQSGRVAEKKGEFVREGTRKAWDRKGDSFGQPGEFASAEKRQGISTSQGGEMQSGEFASKESPVFVNLRPASVTSPGETRPVRVKKGELDAIFGKESPENGTTLPFEEISGDSLPAVSIIGLSFCNKITQKEDTLIDTVSLEKESSSEHALVDHCSLEELRREAKFYESFFDNGRSRQWTGSLIKVLRETTKDARLLAAVGALYYSYFPQPDGRTVYSPGGWFTAACRRYSNPKAIVPSEVRAWSETNLSLKEIRRQVKEGSRLPSEVALSWEDEQETVELNKRGVSNEQQEEQRPDTALAVAWNDESARDLVETSYPLPFATTSSCMGNWMDYEQAERLRNCIIDEGRPYRLRAIVRSGKKSRSTVIVTWPGKPGEIDIINEEDWTHYFSEVKECISEQER